MDKLKKVFVVIVAAFFIAAMLLSPRNAVAYVLEGFSVWATAVMPAMFPFMVLSSLLLASGFVGDLSRFVTPLTKRLAIPSQSAYVLICSLLCGYPSGAKVIADLYDSGNIDSDTAESLLPYSCFGSPMYILGAIGGFLNDYKAAVTIYLCHVLSGFIAMLFGKRCFCDAKKPPLQSKSDFYQIMSNALKSVIIIGGFIAFFYLITGFLPAMPSWLSAIIKGILELTNGSRELSALTLPVAIIGLSAATSFGGLCIILQCTAFLSKTGIKTAAIVKNKLIHTAFALVLSITAVSL